MRVLGTEGVGTERVLATVRVLGTEGVGTVRVLGTVRVGLLSKHCNSCQDDGHIGHHIFTPMLI